MEKNNIQLSDLVLQKLNLAAARRNQLNLYIEAMLEAAFAAEGIELVDAEWDISATGLATRKAGAVTTPSDLAREQALQEIRPEE